MEILVLVVRDGDTAHGMIDFATRLAGNEGMVSVTTCISDETERRRAETRLDQVNETVTVKYLGVKPQGFTVWGLHSTRRRI